MKTPGAYRTQGNRLDGNNGFFVIPHYRISGYEIRVQASDGMGWQHVSVTIAPVGKKTTRCPTWDEMCWVKDQFWDAEECVIQFHPPKSVYVTCHPHCLHLWRPNNGTSIPLPGSELVGPL